MALVSIITACTRVAFLPALAASVLAQEGEWEWLIQLDGAARSQAGSAAQAASSDPRVRIEANPQDAGSAVTRNLALLRASGEYVMCVDDDDLLVPGALAALVDAIEVHPECFAAWGRTRSFDGDPAGSRVFRSWPRPGVVGPNEIVPIVERTGRLPVHVGACLWRRVHLHAVGGYAALLRSIDTNPFLACERVLPLVYVDQDVYLYRRHAEQMTATHYRELSAATDAFNLVRAAAVARVCGRPSPAREQLDGLPG